MEKAEIDFSEEELVKMCIKGDRRSQGFLYAKFSPKMMVVSYRYSRNKEDAADTLMEGFVKVFENLEKFRWEGSLEGWIRKIMVNTAINKLKKTTPFAVIVNIDNYHLKIQSTEDVVGDLGAKELMTMIQQLPPSYQMVFNLYAFEGMKHKEIAESLGITEGTSKSNLYDARRLLQKMIEKVKQYDLLANA